MRIFFGVCFLEVTIKDDLPNFKENILSKIHRIEINLKSEIINSYIDINQHLDFIKIQLFNLKK